MSLITRRLLPLYVSVFFSGLVFWYSIEKLFMTQIGFSSSTIMLTMAMMTAVTLALEIPSGIIADRWSRKGVIAIAQTSLAVSSLIAYLSDSPPLYIVSALIWGIYYAMNSGAVESVIYDVLLEENGSRKGFEKYYGRSRILLSVSLITGALASSAIANYHDIRLAFLLTIPSALIALFFLSFFKEPQLHKTDTEISTRRHLKNIYILFRKKETLMYVALSTVLIVSVCRFISEYQQLWLIALGANFALFGIAQALMNTSFGIAGFATHRLQDRNVSDKSLLIITLLSLLGLMTNSLIIVVASVVASVILLSILYMILLGRLHDQVPSSQRSGVSSTVNMISSLSLLVISLVSSFIVQISVAALAPLLIIMVLAGGKYMLKSVSTLRI